MLTTREGDDGGVFEREHGGQKIYLQESTFTGQNRLFRVSRM